MTNTSTQTEQAPHESFTVEQTRASEWFRTLRDQICDACEAIEDDATLLTDKPAGRFERTKWDRAEGGGGEMSVMRGRVFEKMGVNISTVFGTFTPEFSKNIPGADEDPRFFATGVSLVAHPCSPRVPAVHMNTRFITTTKTWFGGGADLTPMVEVSKDTEIFHQAFKEACDRFNPDYYPKYKQWCDEYFYLPHRNEPRGVGGIFYDYLNSDNWDEDFAFTQAVGKAFLEVYPKIVRSHMAEEWTAEEREHQLVRRGRYAEFNLLHDRGTKFGLMTGGNTEAILMSLPPEVKW
jgi:coproporphyrinogen III oxidase